MFQYVSHNTASMHEAKKKKTAYKELKNIKNEKKLEKEKISYTYDMPDRRNIPAESCFLPLCATHSAVVQRKTLSTYTPVIQMFSTKEELERVRREKWEYFCGLYFASSESGSVHLESGADTLVFIILSNAWRDLAENLIDSISVEEYYREKVVPQLQDLIEAYKFLMNQSDLPGNILALLREQMTENLAFCLSNGASLEKDGLIKCIQAYFDNIEEIKPVINKFLKDKFGDISGLEELYSHIMETIIHNVPLFKEKNNIMEYTKNYIYKFLGQELPIFRILACIKDPVLKNVLIEMGLKLPSLGSFQEKDICYMISAYKEMKQELYRIFNIPGDEVCDISSSSTSSSSLQDDYGSQVCDISSSSSSSQVCDISSSSSSSQVCDISNSSSSSSGLQENISSSAGRPGFQVLNAGCMPVIMQYMMDYISDLFLKQTKSESSANQDFSFLVGYLSNLYAALVEGGAESNAIDEDFINDLLVMTHPWMSKEKILNIVKVMLAPEETNVSQSHEITLLESEKGYDALRELAYGTIYHLSGMEQEGEDKKNKPACEYDAYFKPFSIYRRHEVEKVPYLKSGTQKIAFDDFKAKQLNSKRALVFGEEPASYSGLFKKLKENAGGMSDTEIVEELLNIFNGKESKFLNNPDYSKCCPIVSKLMVLFCYAEARRHPIALMEAYLFLNKFYNDACQPGGASASLADVFNSKKVTDYTPLFMPQGGANMIRGEKKSIKKDSLKIYDTVLPKSLKRIHKSFRNVKEFEDTMAMIVSNLLKHTDTKELYKIDSNATGNFTRERILPNGSHATEGFAFQPASGEGNNCAFNSIAAILKYGYGIEVGSDFAPKMREFMNLPEGRMVELVWEGESLLEALRRYFLVHFHCHPLQIPNFRLNAVINFVGELVDDQDIAHTAYPTQSPFQTIDLDLLYNGINHFDALVSTLSPYGSNLKKTD